MYNPLTGLYDNREEIAKRSLTDIELREISLVNKGANKKKFLFFKSDGDELDMLLSVLEQAQFDSQSDVAISKAVDVLTGLESDERDAIAKTIMAVCQLAGVDIEGDETEVQKIDYDSLHWPSFQASRSPKVKKAEVSDETLWPSLAGAVK